MTTQAVSNTQPDDLAATRVALTVLVTLSCADAALSAWLLSHGLMREANPLMAASLAQIGLGPTLALKLGVTGFAVWTLLGLRRELAQALPGMIWAASATYLVLGVGGLVLGILAATC